MVYATIRIGRLGNVTLCFRLSTNVQPAGCVPAEPHPTTKLATAADPAVSNFLRVSGHSGGFSTIELSSGTD